MRIPRWGYWLSAIGIWTIGVAVLILGDFNLLAGVIALPSYLFVAAARSRDMGKSPWYCLTTLIPIYGWWAFLWLGIARSHAAEAEELTAEEDKRELFSQPETPQLRAQPNPWEEKATKKPTKSILIGVGGGVLLVATAITLIAFLLTDNEPTENSNAYLKCDAWLQQQLVDSPQAAANAENANTVVAYVQSQRPDSCPPSTWNPLVNNVARDDEGNIDIIFATTTGNTGGTAVTMPADGNHSWAYSANQNTWDSRQWTPNQARPTYTPQPLAATTVPAAQGTPPAQYATDPQQTGMQPNAATPDPDHFKEVGDKDLFLGQAWTELDRGLELFYQADYHGALQAFQSAKIHHGKPSSVLENRIGTALQSLGDHQQAIDHFTKAIEIEDGPIDRVNRAISYLETNQCPLAIHDAQQALDMKPESTDGYHTDAEAHIVLSTCRLVSGDNAQAIEHAEAALSLMAANKYSAEESATVNVPAGDIYYSEGNYAKAIEHYSQAIALGDTAEARASRAWAYIQTKDCISALTDSHKALEMPTVSWSGYHSGAHADQALAYCYADESQWEKALQHEESALRLMYENHYEAATIASAEEDVEFLRTQAAQ